MRDSYGFSNARAIKKLEKIAKLVEQKEEEYINMSNEQLASQTQILRERYERGETLDQLLPDAFAVCREASKRVVNMRHFHVQILGGIALHQGRIAQLATGEGKTLMETLPAYLNALTGKGVHIVTVNEYLATRDKEWMGSIFRFLGLKVGVTLANMSLADKRAAYACDITYGTSSEFGFDYLRDNTALSRSNCVQRGHNFVIVDEVDSILIDEARTPLIISGPSDSTDDECKLANDFARKLVLSTNADEEGKLIQEEKEGVKGLFKGKKNAKTSDSDDETEPQNDGFNGDVVVDYKQKTARLTDKGIAKAEEFYQVDNLSDFENVDINHYINNALKAHFVMRRDDDYIVERGAIVLVDTYTGRKMEGRRFSDGLHQALEAKESVKIQQEYRTIATITLQNYFRLYHKLSGMTGTAKTEEAEFNTIYNIDVVAIPTNLPMIRVDMRDRFYPTRQGKINAIVKEIEARHATGQPILIGTQSVEKSEELSKLLKAKGIAHVVLNAKEHANESRIIAQAGMLRAVTIATNMAGRGTDILLGGTAEGLAVREMSQNSRYSEDDVLIATTEVSETEVRGLTKKYVEYFDQARNDMSAKIAMVQRISQSDKRKKEMHMRQLNAEIESLAREKMESDGYLYKEVVIGEYYAGKRSPEQIQALKQAYKDTIAECEERVKEAKPKVVQAGGLCVIGTERHDSRRIDNQLRGRAGRQGDPGCSIFFVSAEDDMMRVFGGEKLRRLMSMLNFNQDEAIEMRVIDKTIESAQKRIEGMHFSGRKSVLQYDDVNNQQRKLVYSERDRILDSDNVHDYVVSMADEYARLALEEACNGVEDVDEWNISSVNKKLAEYFDGVELKKEDIISARQVCELLADKVKSFLEESSQKYIARNLTLPNGSVGDVNIFYLLEKTSLLHEIDELWIENLEALDEIRQGVGMQYVGQHDPLVVYKQEAYQQFERFQGELTKRTLRRIMGTPINLEDYERKDESQNEEIVSEEQAEQRYNPLKVKKIPVRPAAKPVDRPLTEKEKKQQEYALKREQRKKDKANK